MNILIIRIKSCFSKNELDIKQFVLCFSSPEPKAQVSFSGQNLFVIWHRRRWRKHFTFSSSSPQPLGQFQPTWHKASSGEVDSILLK